MVELTSKSSYRIFIFRKSDTLILFYSEPILGSSTPKSGSWYVGESHFRIQALYLGTVLINIPKVKTFVIRTHILVGDKEMHGDMTVTILKYANTPHSKRRRKHWLQDDSLNLKDHLDLYRHSFLNLYSQKQLYRYKDETKNVKVITNQWFWIEGT